MSFLTDEIYKRPAYKIKNPMAELPGQDCCGIPLTAELDDMHTLIIGASNSGKTTQIEKILSQTVKTADSLHIIFDPKGTYSKKFYRIDTDYALSAFDLSGIKSLKWNIMSEIIHSRNPENEIKEIANIICQKAIKENNTNKFFPGAAAKIIQSVWEIAYNKYKHDKIVPSNKELVQRIRNIKYDDITDIVKKESAEAINTIQRILDPNAKLTSANITQEMEEILSSVFSPHSNFCCDDGDFSFMQFIHSNNAGRRLFFIYDPAYSKSCEHSFSVILNILMKECIGINPHKSNIRRVFWYLDELPVLPESELFCKLCSFGRSAGFNNRVIVGIQNVPQLFAAYEENNGRNILSDFTNNIIMKVNDSVTADEICSRSGTEYKTVTEMGLARSDVSTSIQERYIIPKDVIAQLTTGEAVISVNGEKPFYIFLDP